MSFLEKLKEKSPAVKAQVTLLIALLVTGIIGAIWLSTLPARFSDAPKEVKVAASESTEKMSFDKLFGEAASQMASVIESAKTLKDSFTSSEEEVVSESAIQYEEPFTIEAANEQPQEPAEVTPDMYKESASSSPEITASSSATTTVDTPPRTILIGTTTRSTAE